MLSGWARQEVRGRKTGIVGERVRKAFASGDCVGKFVGKPRIRLSVARRMGAVALVSKGVDGLG
jgi:hypothetical protein